MGQMVVETVLSFHSILAAAGSFLKPPSTKFCLEKKLKRFSKIMSRYRM